MKTAYPIRYDCEADKAPIQASSFVSFLGKTAVETVKVLREALKKKL